MKPSEAKQLKPGDLVADYYGVKIVQSVEVVGARSVLVTTTDGIKLREVQLRVPTDADLSAYAAKRARETAHEAVEEEMRRVGEVLGGQCFARGSARWFGPDTDYTITIDRKRALAVVEQLERLRAVTTPNGGLPECEVVE